MSTVKSPEVMEDVKDDSRDSQGSPSEESFPTGTGSITSPSRSTINESTVQSGASSPANSMLTNWNAGDTGSGTCSSVSDETSPSPPPNAPMMQHVGSITSAGGNGHSASWMNGSVREKEGNRAAFNRVVGDAPQRAHIRLKSRHHRGKGDKESDISSDSSSYNRDSPPNVLNLSNIVSKQQDGNLESEGSSGSGTFFRPTQNPAKRLLKQSKAKGNVSQSDAGIAACTSGSSTSQQSGSLSVSRSSSGQDAADDSGVVTRKSTSKRSLATHYQAIAKCPQTDAETFNSNTVHLKTMPTTEPDTEKDRKRRRFNRTFGALRQCGLLDLTMQTATLMEQSQRMEKQLETLRKETKCLYDAMLQFSQVQPTFLETNNAQQVMNNLEHIASGQHDSPTDRLIADAKDTTTQLLKGALTLQWQQKQQRLAKSGFQVQKKDSLLPAPKKLKQKHSASSSQTFTSTNSSPTTDSDDIQKQCGEIQQLL